MKHYFHTAFNLRLKAFLLFLLFFFLLSDALREFIEENTRTHKLFINKTRCQVCAREYFGILELPRCTTSIFKAPGAELQVVVVVAPRDQANRIKHRIDHIDRWKLQLDGCAEGYSRESVFFFLSLPGFYLFI